MLLLKPRCFPLDKEGTQICNSVSLKTLLSGFFFSPQITHINLLVSFLFSSFLQSYCLQWKESAGTQKRVAKATPRETDLSEAPQSSATEVVQRVSHTAAADRTEAWRLAPIPEQISDWNVWEKKKKEKRKSYAGNCNQFIWCGRVCHTPLSGRWEV